MRNFYSYLCLYKIRTDIRPEMKWIIKLINDICTCTGVYKSLWRVSVPCFNRSQSLKSIKANMESTANWLLLGSQSDNTGIRQLYMHTLTCLQKVFTYTNTPPSNVYSVLCVKTHANTNAFKWRNVSLTHSIQHILQRRKKRDMW